MKKGFVKNFFKGFGLAAIGILAGLAAGSLLMAWPGGTVLLFMIIFAIIYAYSQDC